MTPEKKDDGRVIADMSQVERTPMLLPRLSAIERLRGRQIAPDEEKPPVQLDKSERRSAIRGALSAGLLVAGVFALAFALLILLLLKLWG